jgi:threonine/homoserine/homoserine lactone efflux protein
MIAFLAAGITFGLSAGLFPGPLMGFIVSQTLRHGPREGLKGAFAPLFTDPPIMLASVALMGWFSGYRPILGAISCLGGVFVLNLAWDCVRARSYQWDPTGSSPRSLGKAVMLNALSPSPYLFWLLVGGPQVVLAWHECRMGVAGFMGGFFVCLIGSMVLVALAVGRGREWLSGRSYRCVMTTLAALLAVAGVMLLHHGLVLLGVV